MQEKNHIHAIYVGKVLQPQATTIITSGLIVVKNLTGMKINHFQQLKMHFQM